MSLDYKYGQVFVKMIQREYEWTNVNFSFNACYVVEIGSKWK